MTNTISTALSRQSGLLKELNTVSNNIANANTVGFRASAPFYSEYIQYLGSSASSLSQTAIAGRSFDASNGALIKTGAPLDVALQGNGFFSVTTNNGERLTRAGSFTLDAEGSLRTTTGFQVNDETGAPIVIPTDASEIVIASDGVISADGAPVGRFAIVTAPDTALQREGDNLFRSTAGTTPVTNVSVQQGFVENSNVNTVYELGRLIEVQRAFELNQQFISDEDDRITRTIDAFRQS